MNTKEYQRQYQRQYHQLHREKLNEQHRLWYAKKFKGRKRVYNKMYSDNHREERRARDRERRQAIKLDLLGHYSNKTMGCVQCGFSDMKALSIDHIKGGGNAHRKITGEGINFYRWLRRNNYPEGYQVLCMNCQFIKRYDQNGYRL